MTDVARPVDPILVLNAHDITVCWAATLPKDAIWLPEHRIAILDSRLSGDDLRVVVESILERVARTDRRKPHG